MKIVESDTWIDTIEELVEHKEILTNAGNYTKEEIIETVGLWVKDDYPEIWENHFFQVKSSSEESTEKEGWFILRLVSKSIKNNKEAKYFLEDEY